MKKKSRYSQAVAEAMYDLFSPFLSQTGKIDRKAVDNVRGFLIKYAGIPQGKMPATDALFTNKFTG